MALLCCQNPYILSVESLKCLIRTAETTDVIMPASRLKTFLAGCRIEQGDTHGHHPPTMPLLTVRGRTLHPRLWAWASPALSSLWAWGHTAALPRACCWNARRLCRLKRHSSVTLPWVLLSLEQTEILPPRSLWQVCSHHCCHTPNASPWSDIYWMGSPLKAGILFYLPSHGLTQFLV